MAAGIVATTLTACASSTPSSTTAASSVPTSVSVTVPAGAPARTAPGTSLAFGASAVLPANAFTATGATAMYTVTGITPGSGVPDTQTRGGSAYFVYVTVTSLAARESAAPTLVGLAGSADGKTAALTLPPTTALPACTATTPPKTMKRGDSYATCLVAYADADAKLSTVIYWADTTTDAGFDFKSAPVVWGTPNPVASSSAPAAG